MVVHVLPADKILRIVSSWALLNSEGPKERLYRLFQKLLLTTCYIHLCALQRNTICRCYKERRLGADFLTRQFEFSLKKLANYVLALVGWSSTAQYNCNVFKFSVQNFEHHIASGSWILFCCNSSVISERTRILQSSKEKHSTSANI